MQVKDLQPRMGNVDIVLDVIDKSEAREWSKFGKAGKVCNATAKDETGQIKLTFWNEDTEKVNVGDKIEIKNGYVGEYQGEMQLSTGRSGELKVLEKSESAPQTEEKPKTPPSEGLPEEPSTSEEMVQGNEK